MTTNTNTRLSHKHCGHPLTPAARKECRKARAARVEAKKEQIIEELGINRSNLLPAPLPKQAPAAIARLQDLGVDYTNDQIIAIVDLTRKQKTSIAKLSEASIRKAIA
ncbi:hypothetical protein 8UZL_00066 [Mycobacteroides phage 8UZL]|nr:hypothetical protein 8UZL_00066 [Mycobacteroides phage 8UZL]